MLLRLETLSSQSREFCRLARAYARLGQATATSMELGLGKSRFLGIGLEYVDFREYQEGDDVRYVDWILSARSIDPAMGDYKLYTKIFHVEQMKNIIFVADLTNSMVVEEKLATLFYISSLLLELSHRFLDNITLITLAHRASVFRGLRGREAIRVLEDVVCEKEEVGGSTWLSRAVKMFKALAKKSTMITLVTDYAHDVEEFSILAKLKRVMMLPIAVYLTLQKWEIEKPVDNAVVMLIDAETSTPIVGKLEEIYRVMKIHVNHVKTLLSTARINHLEIQGIGDAKTKAVKIVETYLKTRQMQTIER
jgi:uncharacterized protein (DUF58 family)